MKQPFVLAALALSLAAAPALARDTGWTPAQIGQETSIPFIAFQSLHTFKADANQGVWLQDQRRRWYYARTVGPCTDLPFAERIGVDTQFSGDMLDKTGAILVRGQSCPLSSLTASAGPPATKPKRG